MTISKQISHNMQKSSWIRQMFEQGIALKKIHGADNVFDFTLGNPVAEPPPQFRARLQELLSEEPSGQHRYMPNAGYPAVRDAIATALSEQLHVPLTGDHLIMTTGAASALNVVLKSILDPDDEVLVLAPYFVEYLFYVSNHGGVSKVVETDSRFQLDVDQVAAALGPKTKAIIINSPNNPTGVIYPESVLSGLAALLEKHKSATGNTVYVISDEPYRKLVYDGAQVPSVLSIFKEAIVCNSHSKDLSLAGERIGYIALSPRSEYLSDLKNACAFSIRTLGFVNAPALMQRTVATLQHVTIDMEGYRKKRALFYRGIRDAGYECVEPQGAFYLFPRCPIEDDVAFVKILMEQRVLAVPGSGFGRSGYFRLAYCVADRTIESSLPAFRTALESVQ